MEKLVSVGDKVRLAREAKYPPWSQYDIAKASGVSRDKIASWESGRSVPKAADLRKVAASLQVPYPWFHDGEPTPPPFLVTPDVAAGKSPGAATDHQSPPSRKLIALPNRKIKVYGSISAGDGNTSTLDADEFYIPDPLVREDYSGMIIEGESMAPFLEPSDIAIFCDWTVPKPGYIFACELLDDSNGWVVKLLTKEGSDLVLRSLNRHLQRPDITSKFRLGGYLVGIVRDKGNERHIRLNPWGLVPTEEEIKAMA